MYTITVEFVLREGFEDVFVARVVQQARDSLDREPGCRRFDVSTDEGPPLRVFLYELYDDAAAFDAHLASEHFRSFDTDVAEMVEKKTVGHWELVNG